MPSGSGIMGNSRFDGSFILHFFFEPLNDCCWRFLYPYNSNNSNNSNNNNTKTFFLMKLIEPDKNKDIFSRGKNVDQICEINNRKSGGGMNADIRRRNKHRAPVWIPFHLKNNCRLGPFQVISSFKKMFFFWKTAACCTGRSQKSAKKYHLLFKRPHYPHYTQEHLIL